MLGRKNETITKLFKSSIELGEPSIKSKSTFQETLSYYIYFPVQARMLTVGWISILQFYLIFTT